MSKTSSHSNGSSNGNQSHYNNNGALDQALEASDEGNDDVEPLQNSSSTSSSEEDLGLPSKEEAAEDEFHRRLNRRGNRSSGGGAFATNPSSSSSTVHHRSDHNNANTHHSKSNNNNHHHNSGMSFWRSHTNTAKVASSLIKTAAYDPSYSSSSSKPVMLSAPYGAAQTSQSPALTTTATATTENNDNNNNGTSTAKNGSLSSSSLSSPLLLTGVDMEDSSSRNKSSGLLEVALRRNSLENHDDEDALLDPLDVKFGNNSRFSLSDSPPAVPQNSKTSSTAVPVLSSSSSVTTPQHRDLKKKKELLRKQRTADRWNKLLTETESHHAVVADQMADLSHSSAATTTATTTMMEETTEHQNDTNKEDSQSPSPMMLQIPSRPFSNSLDRSSSDQSTSSLFYGKTPNSGALLGKSSSLIFPTMETLSVRKPVEADISLRRKINLLLDQCESVRFPFLKKHLNLSDLNLTAADIPLNDLCGTSLGLSLYKLTLAGNRLGTVPATLVQNLPGLRNLDLSQCELHQLPDQWCLPKLTRLNLSHNRLTDFPEQGILEGLPELQELNMYGNKVAEITIVPGSNCLSKLEILNLGYNDLAFLPEDLDQLTSLKSLKVMNNFLEKVPMRVCDMDLKQIDVSSNPVIQPPIETCERGICSMKRYYHLMRIEAQQGKEKASNNDTTNKKSLKKKPCKQVIKKPYNILKSLRRSSEDSQFSHSGTSQQSSEHAASATSSSSSSIAMVSKSIVPESPLLRTLPSHDEIDTSLLDHSKRISHEDACSPIASNVGVDVDAFGVSAELTHSTLVDEATETVSVNDTLKVIFVGMALVGKTSMIKRLIEGRDAIIPTYDERTVGVDIYQWEPKKDMRYTDIDSRIVIQDEDLANVCGNVDVKLSVWDFAGQHVYHATHELFFSARALYVVVWDMGATNRSTKRSSFTQKDPSHEKSGAFKLTYDSSDEEDEVDKPEVSIAAEEERKRADRALERDVDEKVQFWIDCIQSSAPGAAILPVASFSDYFEGEGGDAEVKRRCLLLKHRLLKHEERRIRGIKERLKDLCDQKRANDPAAIRLRKLLCPFTRPKLLFGEDDDNCVVCVSGTQYTGFHALTSKIIGIATGNDSGNCRYPVFHGHVGARIPRMRLEVRDAVRTMRDRFKVVEWGYLIDQLRDLGLMNVEDISDALFFLTNIGELSYFGGVLADPTAHPMAIRRLDEPIHLSQFCKKIPPREASEKNGNSVGDEVFDDDDERAVLEIDDFNITAPGKVKEEFTRVDDFMLTGLSQFVFLNPRWLVAAVACILRHDLDREIKETRRQASLGGARLIRHASSFNEAHLNCPVITAEDSCLLWQAKRITKKAAERAQEYSNNSTLTPFEFLQHLLIRFGVFVPIDLSIDKAVLGGKEYAHLLENPQSHETSRFPMNNNSAKFFFLPSLLGPSEPSDVWTYKSTDSWKTTLCHSILFPDGVPPGLMERLTASILSSIYTATQRDAEEFHYDKAVIGSTSTYEGRLSVKEIFCWRTASYLKIGSSTKYPDGSYKESIVEIFVHLADRNSHLCVGSNYMGVGMRRLIISGRGQMGDGGRKTWKGGYLLVLKCVNRVVEHYGGLEFERHVFCPECLAKKAVNEARSWDCVKIRSAIMNHDTTLRCQHGHQVNMRLIAGPMDSNAQKIKSDPIGDVTTPSAIPVQDLLRAVVVVGLWDGRLQKVVRVGSGFIADKKRGLIVTASHTLMNIWGDKNYPFGDDYYGLRQGKVVIGVIPEESNDSLTGKDMAVFRYFAKIVAKDPKLDTGECDLDACVLKITTRMENDVGGDGEGCGEQPEKLLLNDPRAVKDERLQSLRITDRCELDEQVRIVGYNQGGGGLLTPGESLNRCVDFARGYVCMRFTHGLDNPNLVNLDGSSNGGTPPSSSTPPLIASRHRLDRFMPKEEIVVICPTIGGHSGGPCVNQQGEVIGILSRADPAENQRCYISPTCEWKALLKRAKNAT